MDTLRDGARSVKAKPPAETSGGGTGRTRGTDPVVLGGFYMTSSDCCFPNFCGSIRQPARKVSPRDCREVFRSGLFPGRVRRGATVSRPILLRVPPPRRRTFPSLRRVRPKPRSVAAGDGRFPANIPRTPPALGRFPAVLPRNLPSRERFRPRLKRFRPALQRIPPNGRRFLPVLRRFRPAL